MSNQLKHDGGAAFPVLGYKIIATGDLVPEPTVQAGMSLRDWLAGMALMGRMALHDQSRQGATWPQYCRMEATLCYDLADAMIAEKNKSA